MADRLAPAPGLVVAPDGSVAFAVAQDIRFGIADVFFNGVPESDVTTINHGLGRIPDVVLVQFAGFAFHPNHLVAWSIDNVGAISFDVFAKSLSGPVGPGPLDAHWLAIAAA